MNLYDFTKFKMISLFNNKAIISCRFILHMIYLIYQKDMSFKIKEHIFLKVIL